MLFKTAIKVPIDSSGAGRGEERAPDALMSAGLAERLGIRDVIEVDVRIRGTDRDAETGVISADQIRNASTEVAKAVRMAIEGGDRPIVLGGDCSLLLGVFLGLGRGIRLWFVDGHADFLDGRTSPTGEAADMDLASLTGHGPPALVPGPPPLVESNAVVLLGHRPDELDPGVAAENARIDPAIHAVTALEIRERGAGAVGQHLAARAGAAPAWIHLDLDVLDEKVLPAVTYPQPLGLDWWDLTELVRPLAEVAHLAGVSVADYNPDLDPEGTYAGRIVDALASILT